MPKISHNRVGSINLRPLVKDDYPSTGLRLLSVQQAEAFLGLIRVFEYNSSHVPVFFYSYNLKPAVELKKQDDCKGLKMLLVVDGSLVLKEGPNENCFLAEGMLFLFQSVEYIISLPENSRVKYLLFSVDPLVHHMKWENFKEGRYKLCVRMHAPLEDILRPPDVLPSPEGWLSMRLINLLYYLSEVNGQAGEGGAANHVHHQLDYALRADAVIQSNLEIALTTKQISREVGLNECNLKKVFKLINKTGMAQYRNDLRIELAKRLLRESDKSIAEIAILSCFSNENTFRYNFQRATKMKPADWRKKYRL